ncbi:MAG: DedA family protein [Candidatus Howiella sp.]
MQEAIIAIIEQWSYLGVTFLIAVENIFPPIPSEVILTFSGFMTTKTHLSVVGVIACATAGSVIGAIVLYYLGKILKKERLKRIVSGRAGKILRVRPEDIENAVGKFYLSGQRTVFFCRFIPIIRSLISIPAGIAEMNMPVFLFYTTVGSAVWNIVLVLLGRGVGANWESIVAVYDRYSQWTGILLAAAAAVGVLLFYRKRRRGRGTTRDRAHGLREPR